MIHQYMRIPDWMKLRTHPIALLAITHFRVLPQFPQLYKSHLAQIYVAKRHRQCALNGDWSPVFKARAAMQEPSKTSHSILHLSQYRHLYRHTISLWKTESKDRAMLWKLI
jgi:hypothetical protein